MKRVLITGASRGIGCAIAHALHKRGYELLCVAKNTQNLESLRVQLGERVEILNFDLMDRAQRVELIAQVRNQFPDVVVHNVGGRVDEDVQPLSFEALMKSVEFNLGIAVDLNEMLLSYMQARGGGVIAHISSFGAIDGNGSPGYMAAKAGLNAYIRSTARFYARDNICIFGVLPGITEGEVWEKKARDKPEYVQEILKKQPLGRFGKAEEVGEILAGLLDMDNMLLNGGLYPISGG